MKRIHAGFYEEHFCGYTYGVNRSGEFGGWTYWVDRDGFNGRGVLPNVPSVEIIRQDAFHVTSKREAVSAVDNEVKRRLVEAASR